ncbi:MAG: metallophosphoesterase [Xanthomonadales bacterium]|nr:metallophosphoesterase [Xanthomonadales bacterium]
MSTLVHLSDLHFGTERIAVVEAVVDLVRQLRPRLVLVTGDLTQRARRTQFADARAFVDRLASPSCVLAGNHDIPLFNLAARFLHPYANFTRAFGAEREPTFDGAEFHVTCIDSTTPRRHKDGEIDAARIERVCARLRSAPADRLRVVALHHPVHAIVDSDLANLAHGHRRAVPAWVEAGADLILGGHIHLPYVRPLRDAFAALPRPAWCVQAGTAISHRTRGEAVNSLNVIRFEPRAHGGPCVIEQWDYDAACAAFTCSLETRVALAR